MNTSIDTHLAPRSRPVSVYSEASLGEHASNAPPTPSGSRIRNPALPPELFVIVKPPPSSATHPLNLQVQLVLSSAPNGRSVSRSSTFNSLGASVSTPTESSTGLTDNFSAVVSPTLSTFETELQGARLERSSSTSSRASSISTTESSGSGIRKKRVMALYDLHWHNVMATTVTDAGTDEKIAKFIRKGESIEIIGFAEIIPMPIYSSNVPLSVSPSATSLLSDSNDIPLPPSTSSPTTSFFGKFKKSLTPKSNILSPASAALNTVNTVRTSIDSRLNVLNINPKTKVTSNPSFEQVNLAQAEEGLDGAFKRAKAYRWVVKRWIKDELDVGNLDWIFEWTKKRKRNRDGSNLIVGQSEGEEDSDPEDSESPWICQLHRPSSGARSLLLATLSPAPHHPRVIAQLAMPFNLRSDSSLTVEELKDMVFVTSLWVLIREKLGGLQLKKKQDVDRKIKLKK